MARIDEIANYSEVSEKAIEAYLNNEVKKLQGLSLKYSNPYDTGYPDRLILLPNGICAWVEVKSKGKKPRKIQTIKHDMLRAVGQKVFVVDSKEKVDNLLKEIII